MYITHCIPQHINHTNTSRVWSRTYRFIGRFLNLQIWLIFYLRVYRECAVYLHCEANPSLMCRWTEERKCGIFPKYPFNWSSQTIINKLLFFKYLRTPLPNEPSRPECPNVEPGRGNNSWTVNQSQFVKLSTHRLLFLPLLWEFILFFPHLKR